MVFLIYLGSRSQNLKNREGFRLQHRERPLIISRFQVQKPPKGLWDPERCLLISRSQNLQKRGGRTLGPGTLTGYIEVSKYPKQGVRTLGLEMVSYYVEVPKSSKYGGRTLGPGALSYYIEVPKSLKEGGTTLGPGTLSYYIQIPKCPIDGGTTLRPGTLSYYIEAPKSLREGGPCDLATRGPGMLSLLRSQTI